MSMESFGKVNNKRFFNFQLVFIRLKHNFIAGQQGARGYNKIYSGEKFKV